MQSFYKLCIFPSKHALAGAKHDSRFPQPPSARYTDAEHRL